ncbi:MAG TPA: hypothetical protein VFO65_03060, partial [Acidimicrobiales bacterium]|nr:hypothetical protein [Acidimicrobiales bacterium]
MRERRGADRRVNDGLGLAGILVILVALGSATEWVPRLARIAYYALGAVVVGVVGVVVGRDHVGPALVVVGLALVLSLAFGPTRRRLRRAGRRFVIRRRWRRALQAIDVRAFERVIPLVCSVTPVPCGERLRVVMPRGTRVADLEAVAETLAATLGLRDVRVERDADQAARAWVTLVRRDPLAGREPLVWPDAGAEALSLWDPIPVGIDEDGGVQWLSLPERNLLLGGEPGAGKSAALSLVVATAAWSPPSSCGSSTASWWSWPAGPA